MADDEKILYRIGFQMMVGGPVDRNFVLESCVQRGQLDVFCLQAPVAKSLANVADVDHGMRNAVQEAWNAHEMLEMPLSTPRTRSGRRGVGRGETSAHGGLPRGGHEPELQLVPEERNNAARRPGAALLGAFLPSLSGSGNQGDVLGTLRRPTWCDERLI